MSRVYESLQRVERERRHTEAAGGAPAHTTKFLDNAVGKAFEMDGAPSVALNVPSGSRLVSLTEPHSLAAEKFRVLGTRLENLRNQRDLKSLLVTSSVVHEGKTFVTGNLGVTLAWQFGSRVLLIEGDLHRPMLAPFLGLTQLRGLTHWWSGREENLARYVHKFNGIPLWLLGGGEPCDQPSKILQSERFAEIFMRLCGSFDWIVVDSPPMSPTVDVSLWLRLVDGMLLVVREGVTPVNTLEKGLSNLDNPKLVGVVLNEASEPDQTKYQEQYQAQQSSSR